MGAELLAGLQAGASVLSQGLNAYSQTKNNMLNNQWNLMMYNRQRNDALKDWQMQADYNSPKAQMQRLKDAGLNANLVYGHGADAQMSTPVRSSSAAPANFVAPKFDLGGAASGAIETYLNATMQRAQMDNIQKQGVLLDQQAKNLAAQEFKIYADTNKSVSQTAGQNIKNQYAPAIAEYSLEGMRAAIDKTTADTTYTQVKTGIAIDENERQNLKTGMTLKVGAETILNMRAQRLRMEWQNLESRSRMNVNSQQVINMQSQRENVKAQLMNIEQMRENLKQQHEMTEEQKRLLQSRPDWWTEQGVNMLSNLLKGLSNFQSKNKPMSSSGLNVNSDIPESYKGEWSRSYLGNGRYANARFNPETGEVYEYIETDY